MKAYSEKTAAVICNRLLSAARKESTRAILHEAWTDRAGRCCLSDGFRAYRLTKAPAGLSVTLTSKPGKTAEHGFNLDPIFAALEAGQVEEMPAPDEAAVKSFIDANSVQQGRRKVFNNKTYDLGECFPMVNTKYFLDLVRLFPAAKWYVAADPYARMVRPLYVVSENGTACLLPVRDSRKPCKAPETEAPAAVPVNKPAPVKPTAKRAETISSAPAWYFVYSRPAGEKRFLLTDPGAGTVGVKQLFAPRFNDAQLDGLKEALDETAAMNPGASFQIRKAGSKTPIYTAVPTFTPEAFAEKYAA